MYLICLFLQLLKRQCGFGSRVTGTAVGAPVPGAAVVSLDLSRHIRDKLPVQKREDFLELEAWLTDGDDDLLAVNRAQLREYITRGTFGNTDKEFVNSACLRLFTKRFAQTHMSWAGAKRNKEFTLKTSKVWELLSDVINGKFPNFQKNMAVLFNNFHKDVGKEATRAGGRRRRGAGSGRHSESDTDVEQNEVFEGSVEVSGD